jgi:hypothetical protein
LKQDGFTMVELLEISVSPCRGDPRGGQYGAERNTQCKNNIKRWPAVNQYQAAWGLPGFQRLDTAGQLGDQVAPTWASACTAVGRR